MTVPGLARFMHLIKRNPKQPPLLPAHRGHIHPKVGTMRRTAGGAVGRHTLQFKGIFQPLYQGCVEGAGKHNLCVVYVPVSTKI